MSKYETLKTKFITKLLLAQLSKHSFNALKVSREFGVARGTIRKYCGSTQIEQRRNYIATLTNHMGCKL